MAHNTNYLKIIKGINDDRLIFTVEQCWINSLFYNEFLIFNSKK